MVYFITFVIILFCIVIRLFSSNYRIRGIAIPITGGFIIHEVLILILILALQYDYKKIYKKQDTVRFVDNPIYFIKINEFKNLEYFYGFTFLSAFLNKLDNNIEDSILKFSSPCVEFLIYTLIYSFSNRLISIDKTLIFLVLIIMSIKTCLKFFLMMETCLYFL
ncbi:hypothetical protein A0H76_30 [Hepatospora eriocheir]|uniref:Uncharacterized protein n=1 Tax=Hepatospora eriocheir TaxID=1081669 RepID=A0A1X0QJC9_9MICR|nr:hypothetical protein A0H76_30 [Hepatospora eriocheir]